MSSRGASLTRSIHGDSSLIAGFEVRREELLLQGARASAVTPFYRKLRLLFRMRIA